MSAVGVVVDGSPRRDGNGAALAAAVTGAVGGDWERSRLYDMEITPCRACLICRAGGRCPIEDDVPALLAAVHGSRYLLFVSPLHFTSLSAPMIAFISRLQAVWNSGAPGGGPRVGALAVTGGSRYPAMFRPAASVARAAFKTLSARYAGMVGVADTDRLPAAENASALRRARLLAAKMRDATGGSGSV